MKTRIAFIFLPFILASCSDFLEKKPMSLSPESYYTIEPNVTSFSEGLYQNNLSTHGLYEWGTFQFDNTTDNMAYVTPSDIFAPGYWKVPEAGGAWDSWGPMYQLNSFLATILPMYENGEISVSASAGTS